MRAGPQTRGPALMRGGSGILTRNNFAGRATRPTFLRAKYGAGQPTLHFCGPSTGQANAERTDPLCDP